MSSVDPLKLLNAVSLLLSPDGGIASVVMVPHMISFMTRFSKKLVSRCIYCNILKASSQNILNSFLDFDGAKVLIDWAYGCERYPEFKADFLSVVDRLPDQAIKQRLRSIANGTQPTEDEEVPGLASDCKCDKNFDCSLKGGKRASTNIEASKGTSYAHHDCSMTNAGSSAAKHKKLHPGKGDVAATNVARVLQKDPQPPRSQTMAKPQTVVTSRKGSLKTKGNIKDPGAAMSTSVSRYSMRDRKAVQNRIVETIKKE